MKQKLCKGEAWAEAHLYRLGATNGGDLCGSPCAPDYFGIAATNEKSAQLAKDAADNQVMFSKETTIDELTARLAQLSTRHEYGLKEEERHG